MPFLRQGASRLEDVLSSPFEVNWNSLQAAGLVAWYPFIASRGTPNLRDHAGRGLTGTLSSGAATPTWVADGVYGAALQFDGSDSVVMPTNSPLAGLSQFTICAWLRMSVLLTSGYAVYQETKTGSSVSSRIVLLVETDQKFVFGGRAPDTDGFTYWVDSSVALAVNTSYFLAAVFDSASGVHTLQINENIQTVSVAEVALSSTPTGGSKLGRYVNDTLGWNGMMGELRFYNYAVPAAIRWQMYDPATRWDLYRPLRRWWALAPSALGVPWIGPRLASIGSRGRPYISPDLGV